jgi:excisionase family DNA binding protein
MLTVREVAARLGVCTATVYKLCERGELAHVRVLNAIRVTPADLAAFISAPGKVHPGISVVATPKGELHSSQPISEETGG